MNAATTLGSGSPWSWRRGGRLIVFLLSSSSIACLLADFYRLCPMRVFTLSIFLPALILLGFISALDRLRGDRRLWQAVMIGLAAGLLAAVAYDIFRLPFVFSKAWGLERIVPPMNLFKVFPRFGAMILGQPLEQPAYSAAAQWIGWLYHFSNGATFGVMYLAMAGHGRRHWAWAVAMAVGIEIGMLLTPYPAVFGIPVTARFVAVTMAAHGIFGVGMGLAVRWMWSKNLFGPALEPQVI